MSAARPDSAHRQLRQLVAERLRAEILEGRLPPGTWIRQERIAKEMGVSQMPVREALRELSAEGLVEHAPYRGVRVAEVRIDDVADLYACRAYVEGLAARAAAAVITDDELRELRSLAEKMKRRLAPRHLAEYRELNRRFHTLVFMASRRPFLVRTLEQLWGSFPTMLLTRFNETAAASLPDRDAEDVAEHAAILDALERRDGAGAERAIRHHIEEAARHLAAAVRHEPPHAETETLPAPARKGRRA
jgi:DNA-binding GntR family transcriptional regulator